MVAAVEALAAVAVAVCMIQPVRRYCIKLHGRMPILMANRSLRAQGSTKLDGHGLYRTRSLKAELLIVHNFAHGCQNDMLQWTALTKGDMLNATALFNC